MGSKKQTTTTESKPWAPAIPALENILANAGNLFDSQGGINAEYIDKEIADLNPQLQETIKNMVNSQGFKDLAGNIGQMTQQGMSGIGQASGVLGDLASGKGSITAEQINEMAQSLYNKEGVESQVGELTKNVQAGLDKNIQQLNQQASASGGMGSSRAGVAEGVAVGKAGEAIASGSAAIQNTAMDRAIAGAMNTLQGNVQTQLGAGQQLGNLGIQSGQLQSGLGGMYQQMLNNQLQGSMIGQNQAQNILNNQWLNAQGQQNMGWDQLNKYLNIAGGIGGMGGTSTSTGPGQSMLGQIAGMGTQLGSAILGNSSNSFFSSDERFKDDIEVVREQCEGQDADGHSLIIPRLVKWTWNDKAHAFFEEQGFTEVPPAFGVIAQELEELGMGLFVEKVATGVEGLDGECRLVNYTALLTYVHNAGIED